jgi:hypothetical protein
VAPVELLVVAAPTLPPVLEAVAEPSLESIVLGVATSALEQASWQVKLNKKTGTERPDRRRGIGGTSPRKLTQRDVHEVHLPE